MQAFKDSVTGIVYDLDNSVVVTVVDGIYMFSSIPGMYMNMPTTLLPYTLPPPVGPSKEVRINQLQATYEIDREKLNRAWLAALIADGAGEVSRKTVVEGQMSDLDDQLETAILTIITEE